MKSSNVTIQMEVTGGAALPCGAVCHAEQSGSNF